MRLVRRDTLPENTRYPDVGCELAASCLGCTEPICKEDNPTLNNRLQKAGRDRAIVKALSVKGQRQVIARRFGISTRTVYRIGQQYREGYVSPTLVEAEGDADMTLQELAECSRFRAPEPLPQLFDYALAQEGVGNERRIL